MTLLDLTIDVKPYLDIDPLNTTDDDILTALTAAALGYLDIYTNRHLEEATYTQQLDGRGVHELLVRDFPLTAVASVNVDSTWAFAAATLLAASDYIIDNEIWIVGINAWEQGVRNVQVAYTAGYTSTTIPADLKQAALMMIEYYYHGRTDRRLGITTRSKNSESLGFQPTVPAAITDMLAPYIWAKYVADQRERANG